MIKCIVILQKTCAENLVIVFDFQAIAGTLRFQVILDNEYFLVNLPIAVLEDKTQF